MTCGMKRHFHFQTSTVQPPFTGHVITYPCWDKVNACLVKGVPGDNLFAVSTDLILSEKSIAFFLSVTFTNLGYVSFYCFSTGTKFRYIAKYRHWLILTHLGLMAHMRTCVPKAGINGRDNWLYSTVSVRCNYLSLPFMPASGTGVLLCVWLRTVLISLVIQMPINPA